MMLNTIKCTVIGTLVVLAVSMDSNAAEGKSMKELTSWIEEHSGTDWAGSSELWVDPSGNNGDVSDATFRVNDGGIVYTWVYDGKPQTGEFHVAEGGVRWKDSWHQAESVDLIAVDGHGALFAGEYGYPAGPGPDWHWRIKLARRPDNTMVVQMTNIAPWGEEARAVRMVVKTEE